MTPSHFKTLKSRSKHRIIKNSKGRKENFDVLVNLNVNERYRLGFKKCTAL
jgi:hypothetical protein